MKAHKPNPRRVAAAEDAAAVRRLLALYADTSDELRAEGRQWYPTAGATVAALAGDNLPVSTTAAIVAALSPRERWRRNVSLAAQAMQRMPLGCLGRSARNAEAIRDGADPADVLKGPKTYAFWRNLCGDGDAVTVDVWATRAALGRSDIDSPGSRYTRLANVYRRAAERVAERPCDFQAIIWLAVRPAAEHTRDTAQIGAMV